MTNDSGIYAESFTLQCYTLVNFFHRKMLLESDNKIIVLFIYCSKSVRGRMGASDKV